MTEGIRRKEGGNESRKVGVVVVKEGKWHEGRKTNEGR
jgi:hypothetical protein